jgi:hypothetical protein
MRLFPALVLSAAVLVAGGPASAAHVVSHTASPDSASADSGAHSLVLPAPPIPWTRCGHKYQVMADWVRIHTRPRLGSTTLALARGGDVSPWYDAPQPERNGFILMRDAQRGVTGWVWARYVDEILCQM